MPNDANRSNECADRGCDRIFLPEGQAIVRDDVSGALYCDALCHLHGTRGLRGIVTLADQVAHERAVEWMGRHRPEWYARHGRKFLAVC